MKKYKRKPVMVEAIQLKKNDIREVYEAVHGEISLRTTQDHDKWLDYEYIVEEKGMIVHTPKDKVRARIGDYIIFEDFEKLGKYFWVVAESYFLENYEEL